MTIFVFGYGSLVWRAGFAYAERIGNCYVKDYRRVFYQGSTDHRGTPGAPGRTVTLEPAPGAACFGAVYRIDCPPGEEAAILEYLDHREKEYDLKLKLDVWRELPASLNVVTGGSASRSPPSFDALSLADGPPGERVIARGALVYAASSDVATNRNWLGPASLQSMARQIAVARGPSGTNADYVMSLVEALRSDGVVDTDLDSLAAAVRAEGAACAILSAAVAEFDGGGRGGGGNGGGGELPGPLPLAASVGDRYVFGRAPRPVPPRPAHGRLGRPSSALVSASLRRSLSHAMGPASASASVTAVGRQPERRASAMLTTADVPRADGAAAAVGLRAQNFRSQLLAAMERLPPSFSRRPSTSNSQETSTDAGGGAGMQH